MSERKQTDEWRRELTEFALEKSAFSQGFTRVAGVDEAGRGPLAGPIVAAAAILDCPMPELDDSKKLTALQRETLFDRLLAGNHLVSVAEIGPGEIDQVGIQVANYSAMLQAVEGLAERPDYVLVDGFEIRGCSIPQRKVIKGDRRSQSIAAASILAKVTRDRIMEKLEEKFPGYGFARHKGYGTQEHMQAIEQLGPCPEHRMSFAPLSRPQETGSLFT